MAKVWLDGAQLFNCVTADDEAGEAVCLVVDAEGCPVIDWEAHEYVAVVVRGEVRIEVPYELAVERTP
jgi:hypothetical protein